ncbi:MAG: threonine/serine dehydratase [Frankiaceae bacterium]|nr:threonine/serine dehydratase [Frankiaceae bacterium]
MDTADLTTREDVAAAARRLDGRVHRTPVMTARSLAGELGCELVLKAELFQRTGSFKVRGALNKVLQLDEDERRRGVVSLSAGNHAAALAYAAREVGTTALVVMPATASRVKVAATEAYGGRVLLTEGNLLEVCLAEQAAGDLTLVHPFDDVAVIAGAGTVGLELLEQVGDLDMVVVPVGGGGLISGVAAVIKATRPSVTVLGVEPSGANAMTRSLRSGVPETVTPVTVADGLATPFAGAHTLRHVQAFVDDVLEVDDDEIVAAFQLLASRAKLALEPSAAAGLAAVLRSPDRFAGRRVAVVVTGGNVDPQVAAHLLTAQR